MTAHARPDPHAAAEVSLLTSLVDDVLVGVEASSLLAVGAMAAELGPIPESDAEGIVDLGHLWGLPSSTVRRRARHMLRVRAGEQSFRLLAGERPRMRTLPRSAFVPLPPLLAGLSRSAAIGGMFWLEPRLGFVVDVARLAEIANTGGGHE